MFWTDGALKTKAIKQRERERGKELTNLKANWPWWAADLLADQAAATARNRNRATLGAVVAETAAAVPLVCCCWLPK